MPIGSASYGRRRIDNPAEQSRTEGHNEQAGGGEGKGHDRICPHRSRGGGCRGGTIVAADGGLDLRQRQGRHTADAGGAGDRHRSAVEGTRLAGRFGHHMAFIQRSKLARETARARPRGGGNGERHDWRACRSGESGNRISVAALATKIRSMRGSEMLACFGHAIGSRFSLLLLAAAMLAACQPEAETAPPEVRPVRTVTVVKRESGETVAFTGRI